MSASLVGSEMCIRDRPRAATGQRGPPLAPRTRLTATGSHQGAQPQPRICLLYTSDAADDM
eukprot:10522207-Alexandrium_andersonii.AAC.1